jgi:F-type H+-transporting ATPase subunit gamma
VCSSDLIVSTHFRTALRQEPHIRRILPIDYDHIADTVKEIIPERGKFADLMREHQLSFVPIKKKLKDYLIEPSAKEVLTKLADHLFFIQMYHLILEANASEHSARRMAMKTASDNASELGEELNLQYNKSRQSKITTEISEISAGAEALS